MGTARDGSDDVSANLQNARRHGRVRTPGVPSSVGPLIDLSASGCRVECERRPGFREGDTFQITIKGPDGSFPLDVRVAWVRKTGWFKHQAGLEFLDVNGVARQQLATLARLAMITESLNWNAEKRRPA